MLELRRRKRGRVSKNLWGDETAMEGVDDVGVGATEEPERSDARGHDDNWGVARHIDPHDGSKLEVFVVSTKHHRNTSVSASNDIKDGEFPREQQAFEAVRAEEEDTPHAMGPVRSPRAGRSDCASAAKSPRRPGHSR